MAIELTIVFIGGSLTEGLVDGSKKVPVCTNVWKTDVIRYYSEKYPDKIIHAWNA